jgi:hypothetical protein
MLSAASWLLAVDALRFAAVCLFIQEGLYLTNSLAQLLSLFNPDVS